MKKIGIVFLFILGLGSLCAEAAIVYLNDGSQLRGTVVSATANDVQLYTPDGTLRIKTDRILRIDYSDNAPSKLPTGSSVPAPSEAAPPASPQAPQQTVAPPAPSVHRFRRRAPPPWREETVNIDDMPQLFTIGFGFAAPLSRVNFSSVGGGTADNGNSGLLLGTQYFYYLNPRLAAGFDLEYFNRSGNNSSGLYPTGDSSVFGDTLLLMGALRYTLVNRGSARPYVMAGIGMDRNSTTIDVTPSPGFSWSDSQTDETRRVIDDSNWGLAGTLRMGIDFHVMEPAIFSLEVGWTGLSNPRAQATSQGQALGLSSVSGNLSAFTLAGRWGWRF